MVEYFEKENNYLKELVDKNSKVLDVGCGNGRTMKFLSPFVREIVGIDYDENMIKEAEKNLAANKNVKLLLEDFFRTNFKDKFDLTFASYNLLGSSEILENQKEVFINKMVDNTNPGGHTVFSVWSDKGLDFAKKYYSSIGDMVKDIRNNIVITNVGEFKRFTKKELTKLANRVTDNFKITELAGIFYLLDIKV